MDNQVVFFCITGPVYCDPTGTRIAFELLEVVGELRECMVLDRCSGLSEPFPIGNASGLTIALSPHKPQCFVVPVGTRLIGCKQSGPFRMPDHDNLAGSNISATCITRSFLPDRLINPSRCIKHEVSFPVMTSTPACSWSAMRSRPIRQEITS